MQLKRMAGMAVAGVLALSVSGCEYFSLAMQDCGDPPVRPGPGASGFELAVYQNNIRDYEECQEDRRIAQQYARAALIFGGTAAILGTILAISAADSDSSGGFRPRPGGD